MKKVLMKISLIFSLVLVLFTGFIGQSDAVRYVCTQTLDYHNGGHTESVNSVSISGYGYYIVSGSDDKTIKVWKKKQRGSDGAFVILQTLGQTESVNSVSISDNGDYIVSVSDDKIIKIWYKQPENGFFALFQTLDQKESVNSVSISGKGDCIVSVSDDKTIKIWYKQPKNGFFAFFQTLYQAESVSSVSISGNGDCIVLGSCNDTIKIWYKQPKNGFFALFQTLDQKNGDHTASVNSVSISNTELKQPSCHFNCIVSVSNHGIVHKRPYYNWYDYIPILNNCWSNYIKISKHNEINIYDKRLISDYFTFVNTLDQKNDCHAASVNSVSVSNHGYYIVSGSDDMSIKIWKQFVILYSKL